MNRNTAQMMRKPFMLYEFIPPINNAIHPKVKIIPIGPALPLIKSNGQNGPNNNATIV
jgi:hypothetical protein